MKTDLKIDGTMVLTFAAIIAAGGVAYMIKKKGGAVVDAAKDVVTKGLNPASTENYVYSGINKIGESLSGTKDWTLGGSIYDVLHADYTPNAGLPAENFSKPLPDILAPNYTSVLKENNTVINKSIYSQPYAYSFGGGVTNESLDNSLKLQQGGFGNWFNLSDQKTDASSDWNGVYNPENTAKLLNGDLDYLTTPQKKWTMFP